MGVLVLTVVCRAQDMALPNPRSPIPAPLADELPALQAQSSWEQDTRYEGRTPEKSQRGVYPVGNGKVFTYMGLGERANTMMALTGPSYASDEEWTPRGDFGELTLDLSPADLTVQKVRRVTNANFVVTEDSTQAGLALRTLTFAAPGSETITRFIEVVNGTGAPIAGLTLSARIEGEEAASPDQSLVVLIKSEEEGRYAVFAMSGAGALDGRLVASLPDLAPGGKYRTVLTIATGDGEVEPTEQPEIPSSIKHAEETLAWWKARLEPTTQLRTNQFKVLDLYNDWKVLMLTMRDEHSGVVSPMVTRRGAWIRESNGPLLTFLRYNMWDEARQLLDYYYNAIRLTGEVREHYPLDLDFSPLAGVETDWSKIRFPESDLMSWIVVQHHWYYRSTWDESLAVDHADLLAACIENQAVTGRTLVRFDGDENFLKTTLKSDNVDLASEDPMFIAESAAADRRSYSLAGGALYAQALNAYGELLQGVQTADDPNARVKSMGDLDHAGKDWFHKGVLALTELEKVFWTRSRHPVRSEFTNFTFKINDTWRGFYAPSLSPVTNEPHHEPFANLNLFPMWVGMNLSTGNKNMHNLRNTLARLSTWRDENGKRTKALVGSTATFREFTGDVPGMLLTALSEMRATERSEAFDNTVDLAEPAGEWGQYYNADGRPIATDDPLWPNRLSPNECGINLDAIIYSLNGLRRIASPNWDMQTIRLRVRLPKGAIFMEMEGLKKDGRTIDFQVNEFLDYVDEDEQLKRLGRVTFDPTLKYPRFRFRMEFIETPGVDRITLSADVSGSIYVKNLREGPDRFGESSIIRYDALAAPDPERYFLDEQERTTFEEPEIELTEDADLIVFTNRVQCAEIFGTEGVTYIDTGLPRLGGELVTAILQDGKPTHPKLYLDVGYEGADLDVSTRLWQHERWEAVLQSYIAAGGVILKPRFIEDYQVQAGDAWADMSAPEGRLALSGEGKKTIRFSVTSESNRDDVVLRIGSGSGYVLRQNGGELMSEPNARVPLRDQDSSLIELTTGENVFEVELDGNGEQVFFARITDSRGLPVDSLRLK